jgi:hypothetical protein
MNYFSQSQHIFCDCAVSNPPLSTDTGMITACGFVGFTNYSVNGQYSIEDHQEREHKNNQNFTHRMLTRVTKSFLTKHALVSKFQARPIDLVPCNAKQRNNGMATYGRH